MEKKKKYYDSVVLVDNDYKLLSLNAALLKEMHIARNVVEFNSGKEAFESLMLMKRLPTMGKHRFPDLLILDLNFPYFPKRTFLHDLLLLYPEKKQRPKIVLLWKNKLPAEHIAADFILQKPLDKKMLQKIMEKKN